MLSTNYAFKNPMYKEDLKLNSLQDLVLVWFGLVWFGLMAYQPLKVINAKSIFIHISSSTLNNSV